MEAITTTRDERGRFVKGTRAEDSPRYIDGRSKIRSPYGQGENPQSRKNSPFVKGHEFFKGGEKGWFKKGHTLHVGRKNSYEARMKMRFAKLGEKHWNWKGINRNQNSIIRSCFLYRSWSAQCLTRDNFRCQNCGSNKKLHVHHIKKFSQILYDNKIESVEAAFNCEELWDVTNGTTLCKPCHKSIHNQRGE